MEIGPNDALGAPRNLDVIKPARFARNYPVFAGLQLIVMIVIATYRGHAHTKDHDRSLVNTHHAAIRPPKPAGTPAQVRSRLSFEYIEFLRITEHITHLRPA